MNFHMSVIFTKYNNKKKNILSMSQKPLKTNS